MYKSLDIVSRGTIDLGTSGPRIFVRGHIVSGRPVTPPLFVMVDFRQWAKPIHIYSSSNVSQGNKFVVRHAIYQGLNLDAEF